MKRALGVAMLGLAVVTFVESTSHPTTERTLAIELLTDSPARVTLTVVAPKILVGGAIPIAMSDYGQPKSPELRWSGVPPGARALVLIVEDPDANEPTPFVHWLVYNLPPDLTGLPEALHAAPPVGNLPGALQGRNSRGGVGYFGPRPPFGEAPHHYHFELFALDIVLTLDPGVDRTALVSAMRGHVIATGELVGTFAAPSTNQANNQFESD